MQEAAETGAATADEGAVALDFGKAAHEFHDRHLRFHARERHPRAGMDAGGEGQVAIRLAAQMETLGIEELRGVAVRGADADMDIRPRRHGDAAQLRSLGGAADAERVRALLAQESRDGLYDEPL